MQALKILGEKNRHGYKLVYVANDNEEYYTHPPGGYRTTWTNGQISGIQEIGQPIKICKNAVHWSLHPASPFQYFAMAKPFCHIEPKDLGVVLSLHRVTVPKGSEIVRDAGADSFRHIEHFKRGSDRLLFGDPLTGWWFDKNEHDRLGCNVSAFFAVKGRLHSVHPTQVAGLTTILVGMDEWLLPSLIVRRDTMNDKVVFRYFWHSQGRIRYVIDTKNVNTLVRKFSSLFCTVFINGHCVPLIHSSFGWALESDEKSAVPLACALAIRSEFDYSLCWVLLRWIAAMNSQSDPKKIDELYPSLLNADDEIMLLTFVRTHWRAIVWPHGPVNPTFLREILLHPQWSRPSYLSAMRLLLESVDVE